MKMTLTPEEIRTIRNDTIEELCAWLTNCIEHVDRDSEVYKACLAMVGGMRSRKEPEPPEESQVSTRFQIVEGEHYPLTHKPVVDGSDYRDPRPATGSFKAGRDFGGNGTPRAEK